MTTLTIARLDEIEAAASKATPGPWTRTGIQDVSGIGMHFAATWIVSWSCSYHSRSVSEVRNTRDMITACDPQTVLALVRIARAAVEMHGQFSMTHNLVDALHDAGLIT